MDAWSRYWKTGARRSPATISITLTGATPPRRSPRSWRNYGPTLIYKQGERVNRPGVARTAAFEKCRSMCEWLGWARRGSDGPKADRPFSGKTRERRTFKRGKKD